MIAEQKYSTTDAKVHQHSFWKRLSTGVPELTSVREVTDKDNKTLVEVIYGLEKEVWAVKIHQVCDFRHISGKFVEQPKAQIYCVITGGGNGSGGIDTVPEDDNIWLDDATLFNLRDVALTNGYNSITKDGKHDLVTE